MPSFDMHNTRTLVMINSKNIFLFTDFPKCYFCSSNISESDCSEKSRLKTCKQEEGAQSHCTSTYNTIIDPITNVKSVEYTKDCSSSYLDCIAKGSTLCRGKTPDKCSYTCCTGKGCNHANEMRVSGVLILACTLFMLFL